MASIKDSLSKGFTVLNVKSSSFLEQNKIKAFITSVENDINSIMKNLGEELYNSFKENESVDMEKLLPFIELIDAKNILIEEKRQELEALIKKEQIILGTGDNINKAPSVVVTCPNCSAQYNQVVKFCKKCGTKIESNN